MSQMQHTEAGG